jgi:hypothetical protein
MYGPWLIAKKLIKVWAKMSIIVTMPDRLALKGRLSYFRPGCCPGLFFQIFTNTIICYKLFLLAHNVINIASRKNACKRSYAAESALTDGETMQHKYKQVADIKLQIDELLMQLSEGEYRSWDTWANNLAHLTLAYRSFAPYISEPGFMAWLRQHDAVMLAEIGVAGRALMALQNFMIIANKLNG